VKRILAAAFISAAAIATPLIGASSSAHALSDNADCVAKVVHVEGTPGETQRVLHLPGFGLLISFVAHIPSEECVF
jgi:hypothetical protein